MFLLDDILLSPVKGLMAIARKVQEIAEKDSEDQEKSILNSLTELHQMFESKSIGDEQFDERETVLLDQLEAVQNMLSPQDENNEKVY
ncbi:MAG: gas vesicle protein GvpG [Thermoguttaceae bacterium]|jgi:hypothetical protein